MGRSKKKLGVTPSKDVGGSGDTAPVQRKRGRPRKVIKEEAAVEDAESKGEDDVGSKGKKVSAEVASGRKRSRPGKKEKESDSEKVVESGNGSGSHMDEVGKKVNHRVGRRRKSEPRRAAGTGTFPEGT